MQAQRVEKSAPTADNQYALPLFYCCVFNCHEHGRHDVQLDCHVV